MSSIRCTDCPHYHISNGYHICTLTFYIQETLEYFDSECPLHQQGDEAPIIIRLPAHREHVPAEILTDWWLIAEESENIWDAYPSHENAKEEHMSTLDELLNEHGVGGVYDEWQQQIHGGLSPQEVELMEALDHWEQIWDAWEEIPF